MAKGIFVQEGDTLNFKNETVSDIHYCDVVPLTGAIGIAESNILAGTLGAISISGVYELPAETTTAFTMGQLLYWNIADAKVTATADGNIPCGMAVAAKVQSSVAVPVKIG